MVLPDKRLVGRRGVAVLEMALVGMILALLAFGTAEYGLYFSLKHTLEGAARDGARAAAVPGATADEVTAVLTAALKLKDAAAPAGYHWGITDASQSDSDDENHDPGVVSAGGHIRFKVWCTWGDKGIRVMPLFSIDSNKQVLGAVVMRKEGV